MIKNESSGQLLAVRMKIVSLWAHDGAKNSLHAQDDFVPGTRWGGRCSCSSASWWRPSRPPSRCPCRCSPHSCSVSPSSAWGCRCPRPRGVTSSMLTGPSSPTRGDLRSGCCFDHSDAPGHFQTRVFSGIPENRHVLTLCWHVILTDGMWPVLTNGAPFEHCRKLNLIDCWRGWKVASPEIPPSGDLLWILDGSLTACPRQRTLNKMMV